MSLFARLVLSAIRIGAIGAAVFTGLVLAFHAWRYASEGAVASGDTGFLFLVGLMFLGSLWLARAVGREIKKPGA